MSPPEKRSAPIYGEQSPFQICDEVFPGNDFHDAADFS
jgi:hypothetical protein